MPKHQIADWRLARDRKQFKKEMDRLHDQQQAEKYLDAPFGHSTQKPMTKQHNYIHREREIIEWGIARNLIGPTGEATKEGQQKKTLEECLELHDAIRLQGVTDAAIYDYDTIKSMARDAIGDIIVTLVMQSQMWGLTIEECIEAAWQEIKDRKGRMQGGVFVKDAPPA